MPARIDDDDPLRILIADEQALFREAMKTILQAEPDIEVVAEAGDGFEAVEQAVRTLPDVAVIDAKLPLLDGVHATGLIRERAPQCRVLVLSGDRDRETLFEAVEAGASGYVTKEAPLADLLSATRAVHRGDTVIPQGMLGDLLEWLIHRRRDRDGAYDRISRLTAREVEVLRLLAQGADNETIGRTLFISPQTARTHVQNILSKLGVHSRLEAAAVALQSEAVGEDGSSLDLAGSRAWHRDADRIGK